MKNPLVLAYIGDTIYDLYVRTVLVNTDGGGVNRLNKLAAGTVNAKAQSDAAVKIMDVLTEEEQSIFRRGRNAKPGTTPKNMSVGDYHRATGLEALLGYLYLTGEDERIEELITMILDGNSIG